MSVPPQYQNLDINYVLGGTNGECYLITGPTTGPSTVTWNGLVYGQGSCLECPPYPTPIPCSATHNFVSPTLYLSSTLYGNFTANYSLACSTLSCLQTSACTLNGGIGLMYMDTSQIQVGTVFYGNTTTCNYYVFTGYYIAIVSSNYVILNVQNGVVVQIITSC
jgi:hypothetical protein